AAGAKTVKMETPIAEPAPSMTTPVKPTPPLSFGASLIGSHASVTRGRPPCVRRRSAPRSRPGGFLDRGRGRERLDAQRLVDLARVVEHTALHHQARAL